MINRKLIFALFASALFTSCGNNQPSTSDSRFNIHFSDTLIYLDSVYGYDNPDSFYDKLIGLPDLQSGNTNDDEIRFWIGYDFTDTANLVLFRKKSELWESQNYLLKETLNENGYYVSFYKGIERSRPRSGWDSFFNQLDSVGFSDLRNYNEIPKYFSTMGMSGLIKIEILKNGKYRKYKYPNYTTFLDEFKLEAKDIENLEKMLILIQSEFGYKLYLHHN